MKRTFCLVFGICAALFLCSCSSFEPTRNLEDALANVEDDLEYHTREYMEKRPIAVPRIHNLEDLKKGKLYYNFAFDQGKVKKNDVNCLSDREWEAFKAEFENAVGGCRRFPIAQILHSNADKKLLEQARSGGNATPEFDLSRVKKPDGIFMVRPVLSVSESLVGKEKTITNTYKLVCTPKNSETQAPLESVPEFSITVYGKVYQLTDRFGRAVAGFRFNTTKQLEDYHLRQGRAAIVKFFAKVYQMFPVGGVVTNFDEDGNILIKASRAEGLQPNMEMVVFALKKSDGEDAIPVPLYNATAITVGTTKSSTLKIWRKSDKKGAQKIIKKLEEDLDEAKEEYDFIAAADGFAQWPDFIDQQNTVKK